MALPADTAGLCCPKPVRPILAGDVLRIAHRLDACESPAELRDILMADLIPFGFKGFTLAIDRALKTLSVHAAILSTWPKGTNERYVSSGLFHIDPVMTRSQHVTQHFVWDMSIYDASRPEHAQLIALRRSLGNEGGIVLPMMEYMGGRTILYLSGVGFPVDSESILCLRLILQHAVAQLNRMAADGIWKEPHTAFVREALLSARERQVLGWIAFGKSSKETALIMGISEHTVNEHIAGAVEKLQASNRTEAVTRAMLLGDIDIMR